MVIECIDRGKVHVSRLTLNCLNQDLKLLLWLYNILSYSLLAKSNEQSPMFISPFLSSALYEVPSVAKYSNFLKPHNRVLFLIIKFCDAMHEESVNTPIKRLSISCFFV